MVEGYPYELGGWGVPAIFKEAGRLLGKYFKLLAPFIVAFVLPTALIQLLEVFGLAWWAAGQSPFLPPGPHPNGHRHLFTISEVSAPGWEKGFFVLLAVGVLLWLLASLAVASVSKVVQYIYSEEEDPSAVKSIFVSLPQAILRLLVTSIWVLLLTLAIVITVSLPFYLLSLIFGPEHEGLLATLNQVFVSVGVTLLGFLFLLSQEVAVLEPDNYGLHALKRSAKLVQEKFLAALAVFALSILVGGLLSRLSNYVAHLHDTGKLPRWTVYILAILLVLLYLAYSAYVYLVTVVLYFSSKVRHDSEEGTLPSHDNPYTPLVVPAED